MSFSPQPKRSGCDGVLQVRPSAACVFAFVSGLNKRRSTKESSLQVRQLRRRDPPAITVAIVVNESASRTMGSLLFLSLPVMLLVLVGVGVYMFCEAAFAGPSQRRSQRPALPLLSGEALLRWAREQAEQLVARFNAAPINAVAPVALARQIEDLTTRVIEESLPESKTHWADRCGQRRQDPIFVTPPEALAIAAQLRQRMSGGALARLRRSASASAARLSANGSSARGSEMPVCPLLAPNGCCLTFSARPIQCRGQCLHLAAETMTREDGEPTVREFVATLRRGITTGLASGLEAGGRDGQCYELNAAIARALETPDAAARWSRGEAIFAACSRG